MGTRAQRADERLRLLESALGDLRNRQLAHGHLEGLAARAGSASVRAGLRRAARLLDAEVRERAVEARWLAQTSRRLLLPGAGVGPVAEPGPVPSTRWDREAERRYRRFRKALRAARKSGSPADLHALRQQLRRIQLIQQLRSGGSLASAAASRRAERTIVALGEIHDLDVLKEIVEALPTGGARTMLVDDLLARRRERLGRVVRLLRSRRLQRFGRSV